VRRASAGSPGFISSRAKELARSEQTGAAIKLLEASLEEHPTNVFFLNQAAYLYKRTGNSVKAIEYLERSRRINPRDMFTINTLGNLYAGQGRAADAERVLTELSEANLAGAPLEGANLFKAEAPTPERCLEGYYLHRIRSNSSPKERFDGGS
jgi:Flp pilus assembly protein TadD